MIYCLLIDKRKLEFVHKTKSLNRKVRKGLEPKVAMEQIYTITIYF